MSTTNPKPWKNVRAGAGHLWCCCGDQLLYDISFTLQKWKTYTKPHILRQFFLLDDDGILAPPDDFRGWSARETKSREMAEEKKVKNSQQDERGWGVSSTIASCSEKSIHHFHVFMSWLTLAIARSVVTMTLKIDEVQAGVASRGLGYGQTRCGVRWGRTDRAVGEPAEGHDSIDCPNHS